MQTQFKETPTTSEESQIVTLTAKAQAQVRTIFSTDANAQGKSLRLSVVGGGCSSLSYKIDFDLKKEKDLVQTYQDFLVVIDPKSAIYLKGVELEFQDGINGKGFIFQNPNASNTCGCGESFSV